MFKPAFATLLVAACCPVVADTFAAGSQNDTFIRNDTSVTNNGSDTPAIEHISIYANRTARVAQDVLASITILNRSDILARQANDLPELLAQLPGINMSRDGGRGQNSSVYVRGGNTGHTLVLVDGVRTGSATLGYKPLSMVPLALIERIEVIRGPRAAWYGSDALAGVIAITTRRSSALELHADVGSFGQASADISASKQREQLTLWASAGVSQADGFNAQPAQDPDSDGYQQQYLKAAADYRTDFGLWSAQADVNSGFNQFDTSFGTEDETDTLSRTYLLGWQQQLSGWQHQTKLSRTLDSDSTFGPDSRSPFVTERDEFNYQLTTDFASGLGFVGGANWYQEQVAKSATAYEQTSRINRAVFAGINYDYDALQLEAAARHDAINYYGAETTWQLAAGYQFANHWQLRVSRGTAFKVPSFNQLYFPGFANPDLKPEQSVSDEIALSYLSSGIQLQLAWFDREVTNLIQGVEQAENVLLATVQGIELSLSQQWQQWRSNFSYSWLDTENLGTGQKLERRPENTVNWRGSYTAVHWSAFITADYQSATYQGADWFSGDAFPAAPAHTVWGAGLSYSISPQLTLRARLANLTDKQYYTSRGYATAGANFGVSVSYILQ
ncbi:MULTISPECIES: TonB-dependent receptor domain-containing protein [unclassified Arsukibacterium]|uniref:TonB-dependent receptor domain-containing protein n=1 Tax=unclassified Arsukibacterium TaxID=2635278 RepID=UPI0025BAB6DB|nr:MULTISPECIES: TonB-dependent receptor [unclassified Arsukibacterium]|tara:strand:- start:30317 stop:32167 length:1851 start_codon:yes stop_codon:yes gene_type:complete